MLKKIVNDLDETRVPNFPFNGKYVIDQGLKDGKMIGFALKELEKEWIEKNFFLKSQEAISIIEKIKKLNILNI